MIVAEVSVVPATMLTGELTVAPLEGVQMVTEGLTVLNAHGAAKAEVAFAMSVTSNKISRSFFFMGYPKRDR
jgi:hypothetical protein